MKFTRLILTISLLAVLLISACSQSAGSSDFDELVRDLESNGADVATGEKVEQSFFSVPGEIMKLNGHGVQVFAYASDEKAGEAAYGISGDGSEIKTGGSVTSVDWIDEPHFYTKGRLIVLYVGHNQEVLNLLESSLGKQIAWQNNNTAMKETMIKTRAGGLALMNNDGTAILTGTLQRSTPCVNWTVQAATTKDLPISSVNIRIFDSNKGDVCIQVLGQPQEIRNEITQVSDDTNYVITFEGERVFEGRLNEGESK